MKLSSQSKPTDKWTQSLASFWHLNTQRLDHVDSLLLLQTLWVSPLASRRPSACSLLSPCKNFLKATGDRRIGEATRDCLYGTGHGLRSPHVLDTSRWDSNGNMMGKCLEMVRSELWVGTPCSGSTTAATCSGYLFTWEQLITATCLIHLEIT